MLLDCEIKVFKQDIKNSLENSIKHVLHLINFAKSDDLTLAKLSFFIGFQNNSEYDRIKRYINSIAKDLLQSNIRVVISVIAQASLDQDISVEALYINSIENDIASKQLKNMDYLIVKNGNSKALICAAIQEYLEPLNACEASTKVFKQIDELLELEGFEYSDIIRQWNYIEGILKTDLHEGIEYQRYQVFNDVRTVHYNRADFKNGYPAATGIGQSYGGILVDFIALKNSKEVEVLSLGNPFQIDAHQYSECLLVGKELHLVEQKTTPKFERAKIIRNKLHAFMHISGTAAIRGENTIPSHEARKQTQTTIENIETLIEEFQKLQINHGKMHAARVYIKNAEDFNSILQVCQEHFEMQNLIFVQAHVCRDNLLVEIEGYYY
jgi:enamine deaminase RidA (YjgF/YER057c/UK114 family)